MKDMDLYKVDLFKSVIITFKAFAILPEFYYYISLMKAVNEGLVDFDKTIIENVESFKDNATEQMKTIPNYNVALEDFKQFLTELNEETKNKYYNIKLIDYILEKDMAPYAQVDVARMYFMNPHKSDEEKKEFLNTQAQAILDCGTDLRIVNTLDKLDIDPQFLKNNLIYQLMIERLLFDHLKDFDKYKESDKKTKEFDRYVIRMIYRHQNRGYYIPDGEYRDAIINTYAYNGWFKELKHMINKNSLGITKDNYLEIVAQIQLAFDDMAIVCRLSEGMYMAELEKYNEIIAMVCEVASQEHKLTRKGGE